MKLQMLWSLAALALAAAPLRADRVVTTAGGIIEGSVTESGQTVYVDGPFGRVRLERKDVREIIRETATQPADSSGTVPATSGGSLATPDASEFPRATTPKPIIFSMMRRLTQVRPGIESAAIREGIERWRALEHDGAVKAGTQWVNRAEIARRRENYQKLVQEAETLLRTMKTHSPTPQEEQENSRIKLQAQAKLRTAAGNWPDPAIRSFLLGDLALQQDNATLAQRMFSEAIALAPHVPGFYHGRAAANLKLDRPMEALADAMTALRLKDDEAASFFALKDVMAKVPGGRTREPLYQQAEELIALYNEPASRPRESTNRGTRWVMPGGFWQAAAPNSLPTPPVDMFVTYRAVAVPVNETGAMLTDGRLIEGAAMMLLEIAPGQYTTVTAVRASSSRQAASDSPVAAVQAQGVNFTPVALGAVAPTAGQELTSYSHTAPLEMMPEAIRQAKLLAKEVTADGAVLMDPPLLAGEAAAAVLDKDNLAGFLAGRTDARAEMGGPNLFIGGPDFAKLYETASRARRSSLTSGYGRLTKKADPPLVEGNIFTLYIIVGQGGPMKKP